MAVAARLMQEAQSAEAEATRAWLAAELDVGAADAKAATEAALDRAAAAL